MPNSSAAPREGMQPESSVSLSEDQRTHDGAATPPVAPSSPASKLADLRRPFKPEAVKWKVQTGRMVVPYIDARLVIERLNHVCRFEWSATYDPAPGEIMWCHLTVGYTTRSDVGSGYKGKGLISDALKRAAVHFGVGISLYSMKKVFLDVGPLLRDTGKTTKKGDKIYALTDKGEEWLREKYAAWLETEAGKHFGEPLDHGDVFGSIGDPEADAPVETEAPAEDQPLTDDRAKELIAAAEHNYSKLPAKERKGDLLPAAFKRALAAASTSHEALEKLVNELAERSNG